MHNKTIINDEKKEEEKLMYVDLEGLINPGPGPIGINPPIIWM